MSKKETKNGCEKHPKYNGIKPPKYQCEVCLALYAKIGLRPRAPIKPTKVEKSKKAYDRKRDKKDWER